MTTRGRGNPPAPENELFRIDPIKTIRILHDRNDHSFGILYRFERPVLIQSGSLGWKMLRARGGCLGAGSRRRARQAAISPGEAQTAFDPGIPEWGNPAGAMPRYRRLNQIGRQEATGGTETSKYPEEEKSTEIPGVAASETGPAQTGARVTACGRFRAGVAGRDARGPHPPPAVINLPLRGTAWEGRRNRVRAPYPKRRRQRVPDSQSSAGHVKPRAKQGGPPSKAEHSPATDSEPVPRGKGEKHPERGVRQRLKPRAHEQPEHPQRCDGVPFVE